MRPTTKGSDGQKDRGETVERDAGTAFSSRPMVAAPLAVARGEEHWDAAYPGKTYADGVRRIRLTAPRTHVEELRKQLEPEDVHIVTVRDRSDLVAATVSKIGHAFIEGVLVIVVRRRGAFKACLHRLSDVELQGCAIEAALLVTRAGAPRVTGRAEPVMRQ
jgi:hypothetical protein